MRQWEKVVPSLDREIFQKAGFNKPESFRGKPAILLVDIVESFTGTRLQPVIEAIDEHPVSCGESAWIALPKIKELISVGRKANVPIIYTKGDAYQTQFCGDRAGGGGSYYPQDQSERLFFYGFRPLLEEARN
jgi:hypothetical protein